MRQAVGCDRTALPRVTIVFTTLAGWDGMKVGSANLTGRCRFRSRHCPQPAALSHLDLDLCLAGSQRSNVCPATLS